jgi:hypothetical protein
MKVLIVDASLKAQQRYADELRGSGMVILTALNIEQVKKKLKRKYNVEFVVWGEMPTPHENKVLLGIIAANQNRFPDAMIATAEMHADMIAQVLAGCTIALERDRVSGFLQRRAMGEPIQRCCGA